MACYIAYQSYSRNFGIETGEKPKAVRITEAVVGGLLAATWVTFLVLAVLGLLSIGPAASWAQGTNVALTATLGGLEIFTLLGLVLQKTGLAKSGHA